MCQSSYLLLLSKSLPNSVTWNNIHHFTVSMRQGSRCSFCESSAVTDSHRLQSQCWQGLMVSRGLDRRRHCPRSLKRLMAGGISSWAVGLKPQFLTDYWLNATLSSLPGSPLRDGKPRGEPERLPARKNVQERWNSIFYNLIMKVTSCHFCHIVCQKQVARSSPQSSGGG